MKSPRSPIAPAIEQSTGQRSRRSRDEKRRGRKGATQSHLPPFTIRKRRQTSASVLPRAGTHVAGIDASLNSPRPHHSSAPFFFTQVTSAIFPELAALLILLRRTAASAYPLFLFHRHQSSSKPSLSSSSSAIFHGQSAAPFFFSSPLNATDPASSPTSFSSSRRCRFLLTDRNPQILSTLTANSIPALQSHSLPRNKFTWFS